MTIRIIFSPFSAHPRSSIPPFDPSLPMRDPYNPTQEEIRAWAASPEVLEPVEDWALMISDEPYEQLYLELAADEDCPTRRYFLALLYLVVGDAVRSQFRGRSRDAVLDLLERGRAYPHPEIDAWRQRSAELLRHPETFEYYAWCDGGLAGEGA